LTIVLSGEGQADEFLNKKETDDLDVILQNLVRIESQIHNISQMDTDTSVVFIDLVEGLTQLALQIEAEARHHAPLNADRDFNTLVRSIGDRGRAMLKVLDVSEITQSS